MNLKNKEVRFTHQFFDEDFMQCSLDNEGAQFSDDNFRFSFSSNPFALTNFEYQCHKDCSADSIINCNDPLFRFFSVWVNKDGTPIFNDDNYTLKQLNKHHWVMTQRIHGLVLERDVVQDGFVFRIKEKIEKDPTYAGSTLFHSLVLVHHEGKKQVSPLDFIYSGLSAYADNSYQFIHSGNRSNEKIFQSSRGWIAYSNRTSSHMVQFLDHRSVYKDYLEKDSLMVSADKQVDFINDSYELQYTVFTGPLRKDILERYKDEFDSMYSIFDWGTLWFVVRPLYGLFYFLLSLFNNPIIALAVLTVFMRIVTFPFVKSSYKIGLQMQELKPKIATIERSYKKGSREYNEAILGIYQKSGINPLKGIIHVFIQIPLLFALYRVLLLINEFDHSSFLWVKDLSVPDEIMIWEVFGLTGLINLVPSLSFIREFLPSISALSAVFVLSIYVYQFTSSFDRSNKALLYLYIFLPVFLLFVIGQIPSYILVYWIFSNILSFVQTKVMLCKDLSSTK